MSIYVFANCKKFKFKELFRSILLWGASHSSYQPIKMQSIESVYLTWKMPSPCSTKTSSSNKGGP